MTMASRLIPVFPVAAFLAAGAAQADTRASVQVNAEGGYGSNPFFGSNQDQASASASISATPSIVFAGPTSSLNLNGAVEHSFFASRFNDITNWSLGAGASLQPGPRSTLLINGNFASTVQSGLNSQVSTVPEPTDGTIPLPDPSAAELVGQRSKTLSGTASFNTSLSPRTTLTLGLNGAKAMYPSGFNSDYVSYGSFASLSRAINAKLNVGLDLTFSNTDYDSAAAGSFRVLSPHVQATMRLSARTTLTASAGISASKIYGPSAAPYTVHFSGDMSLCHKESRSNFCLVASRSVGTTAQQGNSTITAVGSSYSYQLTPRSSFNLAAQYSESKGIGAGTSFDSAYINGSAGYQRTLTERLSISANVRYTNPFRSVSNLGNSFYGGVSLGYRFGR